jgi:glycogen synthase kinase 3 beta
MQYTQCKIVGNGSFGVVFQTKMSPSGEDAAIKRVLQDKRFKVSDLLLLPWCRIDIETHLLTLAA